MPCIKPNTCAILIFLSIRDESSSLEQCNTSICVCHQRILCLRLGPFTHQGEIHLSHFLPHFFTSFLVRNARASPSSFIQVVFSSERLCGWGGGHICSAEASVGPYSRVVTLECHKESMDGLLSKTLQFRVCQSIIRFVDLD